MCQGVSSLLILDGSYVCLIESCEFSKTGDSFVLNCSSGSNSAGSKNGCSQQLFHRGLILSRRSDHVEVTWPHVPVYEEKVSEMQHLFLGSL